MIREYRDSEAYLMELDSTYADDFDDCLRQVKASFPKLDLSHVLIDAQAQTSAQPVHSKSTDELFADDALANDPRGDGESTPIKGKTQSVEGDTRQPEDV